MMRAVRAGDTVARLGGDEFVILLEDVGDGSAPVALAERLVRELAEPVELAGRELRVGASIGVATCTDGGVEAERLLGEADAAAYRAKNAGRGRVSVFDDSLRAELASRYELDAAISAGLDNGEFELYYQPIVDLPGGRPYGAEALIRWHRPGHGLVPPDEFIPAAELSRRINDIGRWTLVEALTQLARWDLEADGHPLTVAVNISGRHLASNELIPDVRHALAEADIPAERLTVEVTETFLVSDPAAMQNLVTLRDMGVRVALDDFGTGFTSVRQLRYLPIDCIKIDRSFVVSTDPAERELVQLMANAAQAFGVDVVAEGIEGPEHLTVPIEAGIIGAQGYYFSRPVPAAQAIALLRAERLPSPPTRLPAADLDVRAAL
jgi:predicted signal transduction protein with EAL and GGDEF domain